MKLSKEKVEIAMASACMNAYAVCEKAEMPYPTFAKAKRGVSCKPATAGRIAKALNVPLDELLEATN